MDIDRREFVVVAGALVSTLAGATARVASQRERAMYGLIGKLSAAPGQRDALTSILLENKTPMPGCLSYIVAHDPEDANAIWITEVWDSQASHAGSLSLPAVKEAIAKARPLIAGFSNRSVTAPVGGYGLVRAAAPEQPA